MAKKSQYGRWKCKFCNLICHTRRELFEHIYSSHRAKYGPHGKGSTAWNHGKTKNTDFRIANQSKKIKAGLQNGSIIPSFLNKHHSDESKLKISNSMKHAHLEGRAYCWTSNQEQSFPELYFQKLFIKENIDLQYHLQISKYQLDFYNKEKMFYVEIDGEQHFRNNDRIEHDKIRSEYLNKLGWTEYRIRWSDWQKLSFDDRHKIIEDIRLKLI